MIKSDVDGECRAPNLVLSSRRKLKRPFRLIYPLEGSGFDEKIDDEERVVLNETRKDANDVDTVDEKRNDDVHIGNNVRQGRKAAVDALSKIRQT